MDGHGVMLAALLMQPQSPSVALLVVVAGVHGDDGRDAREAVNHDPEQGTVAQAGGRRYVDAVDQLARFVSPF